MKRMFKYILLMLALLTALSACSSGNPPVTSQNTGSQLHLVFVTPLYENQVWQAARDGFDAAARDLNFRGDWVGPTAIDVDEMIRQIKIAIAEKADGIITQGTNPEVMVPVLKQAYEAGIRLLWLIPTFLMHQGLPM